MILFDGATVLLGLLIGICLGLGLGYIMWGMSDKLKDNHAHLIKHGGK